MIQAIEVPEGFKVVPLELSDQKAEIIANHEVDEALKLQHRTRQDYPHDQLKSWIEMRQREAKKRYTAALALLDLGLVKE